MPKFLGLTVRERRPVAKMLSQHEIATPTSILAAFVALRIAQLPADPSAPYKGQGQEVLKLRNGRTLEITILKRSGEYTNDANLWCSVRVGMPGAPRYKSVEIPLEESGQILEEFRRYRARSIAAAELQKDSRNQQTAVDLIEELIGGAVEETSAQT
jgi:hypothetical protein